MSESSIQKRIMLGAFAVAAASVPLAFGAKSAVAQSVARGASGRSAERGGKLPSEKVDR